MHEHDAVAEKLAAPLLAEALLKPEKTTGEKGGQNKGGVSPLNGARLPPTGRPKGVPNRVTRTIREAVEMASQPGKCHPEGLAGWLIERAKGGIGDRQIFAGMVMKAMPLQVHANVDGAIKLELGWLGARQIGTPTAQIAGRRTQVLDLQPQTDGTFQIVDPQPQERAAAAPPGQAAQEAAEGDDVAAGYGGTD
jgi:hypothetical protein